MNPNRSPDHLDSAVASVIESSKITQYSGPTPIPIFPLLTSWTLPWHIRLSRSFCSRPDRRFLGSSPIRAYPPAHHLAPPRGESIYSKRPESRNRLPTQADDAARSEFERAPQRGINQALPPAASPEPSEAKPRFSLSTSVIDDSPVRRYSSRQKRASKFPIRSGKGGNRCNDY